MKSVRTPQRSKRSRRPGSMTDHNPKREHRCPCGKVRYRDRREARDALLRITVLRKQGCIERQETDYYACKQCKGFHLTSMTSAVKRRQRDGLLVLPESPRPFPMRPKVA